MNGQASTVSILSAAILFREGLKELLRSNGFSNVATYGDAGELIDAAKKRTPRVVLVDLDHQCEDLTQLLQQLRRALRGSHIVSIGSALRQAPVDGVVDGELETPSSNIAGLLAATRSAPPRRQRSVEGTRLRRIWSGITPRQREVLRWMATGADNRTIAGKLQIGERAVKVHVSSLLDIFGLRNRAQLSLLAHSAGFRPKSALLPFESR